MDWETLNKKAGGKTQTSSLTFDALNSTALKRAKGYNATFDANVSAQESAQANSLGGIVKNAAKAAVSPFIEGAKEVLSSAPSKTFDATGFDKLNQLAGAKVDKTNLLEFGKNMTPVPAVDIFKDTLSSTIKDAGERLYNAYTTVKDTHASNLKKGVAIGEAGIGAVNALFSPVSATLSGLSTVPGVGYLADAVNAVFGALGKGGSENVMGAVDALPLSKETKDTIKPLAGEVGALVTQILAGKAGGDVYAKVGEKSKAITDAVANDPVVQQTPVEPKTEAPAASEIPKVGTQKTSVPPELQPLAQEAKKYKSAEEFVNNQTPVFRGSVDNTIYDSTKVGKEGVFVSPSEDIASSFGKGFGKGAEKLYISPNAKILEWKDVPEQFKNYENKDVAKVQEGLANYAKKNGYDVVNYEPKEGYPGGIEHQVVNPDVLKTKSQLIDLYNEVNKSNQTPNTRADTLLKAAVEKQFMDNTGDIPTHEVMNMKNESLKAVDYITKNPEEAKAVALGDVVPKSDVFAEHVYNALEIKAFKEGDVALMRELATSKVPTEAGQRLKALDSIDPNSPVKIMRDLQKTREQALGKKGGVKQNITRETESIKSEIKNTVSKRPTWESFIEEIKCAY